MPASQPSCFCSHSYLVYHHRLISVILEKAKRERLVPFNVAAEHATAPKMLHKEAAFLDDEQARDLLSLLLNEEDIRIKTSFVLPLFYRCPPRGTERPQLA